ATQAWSIPMRPPPASTTLEAALTIPVNIHVSADEQIIAESGEIDLAKANRIRQAIHALAANRTDCLAAADDHRCHVCVGLVDQPLIEECCVQLPTAFHQKAQKIPPPELFQQRRQRDAVAGVGGQA